MIAAAGLTAALWHPSPEWIERSFTNGYFPGWQHFWCSIAAIVPFSLGDIAIAVGALAIVIVVVRGALSARRRKRAVLFLRALIVAAGIGGAYACWFYAGWGWGYDRAPLQTRAVFNSAHVNPQTIAVLRAQAAAQMNGLVQAAHSLHDANVSREDLLRGAWQPVVQRLGDDWMPLAIRAKWTLAGPFMNASGTSGFTNPFTLETQLAPDLLWFERPFSQAHEWSHAAGYNREDEANYIAALTCLRDPDPVARYSGWFELFLTLPPLEHYPRSLFVAQVWRDFGAIRARNARYVSLRLSRFSWRVYNSYLKSNHIASGVENYDEVTILMAGIPLDAQGLPIRRVGATGM